MVRISVVTLISVAIVACGAEDTETNPPPPAAADPVDFDAFIEYRGRRYEMSVPGNCGAESDGTYLTWAVTHDLDGKPIPDAAHMYAMHEAHWSVIDFYSPDDDRIVRIYREGREQIRFENGVLEFEGELGAGLTEKAKVRIVCPSLSSSTSQPSARLQERLPGRLLS